jgi:hypothetical protein
MDAPKQQVAERIKQANNILVTVSSNPSVDQLSACIGITLALNKMGKHGTAVFSGEVPSMLEFLQPEKTIEKNTDSLRDFIIALDKSKADKLRYKVEDKVVKIFITPYKTSITNKDLNFSQGDFNVDVVLALGVHQQADLDQAITAHGRILHDATVITMNVRPGGELGSINWLDASASSLSELTVQLLDMLDKTMMDGQIATAMLTGIVAETDRFSNAKTSPQTMSISAELMANGANQQLVATKLEEPPVAVAPIAPLVSAQNMPSDVGPTAPKVDTVKQDGTLEISHDNRPTMPPAPVEEKHEPLAPQIHIDEQGSLLPIGSAGALDEDMLPPDIDGNLPSIGRQHSEPPRMITQPPTLGGQLTANTMPEQLGSSSDPLTLPSIDGPLLSRDPMGPQQDDLKAPTIQPLDDEERPSGAPTPNVTDFGAPQHPADPARAMAAPVTLSVPETAPPALTLPSAPDSSFGPQIDSATLSQIEQELHSDHSQDAAPASNAETALQPAPAPEPQGPSLDQARSLVDQAINTPTGAADAPLPPIEALNAQPVNLPLATVPPEQPHAAAPAPVAAAPRTILQPVDPNSPPPVPPPMMPPTSPYQV